MEGRKEGRKGGRKEKDLELSRSFRYNIYLPGTGTGTYLGRGTVGQKDKIMNDRREMYVKLS